MVTLLLRNYFVIAVIKYDNRSKIPNFPSLTCSNTKIKRIEIFLPPQRTKHEFGSFEAVLEELECELQEIEDQDFDGYAITLKTINNIKRDRKQVKKFLYPEDLEAR